jgi:cell division protein FtsW
MLAGIKSNKVMRTEWGLLLAVLALVIIGLVMVYSASYGFSLLDNRAQATSPTYFVKRQIGFVAVGFVALLIFSRIDYHLYRRYAVQILVGTVLLLLPMVFIAKSAGGAARWIFGNSVQPSEIAKLGALIYIAVWLAAKGEQIRNVSLGLIPFALLLGCIAGLIVLQPNFSMALLLVATSTAMFFAAGADIKQLLIAFLFGGVALVIVALAAPYRFERVDLWLRSPFSDASGKGFQVVQALAALNKGGFLGDGLGQSKQKFTIFAPHTDGMFAIVGEELGFLGAAVIIGLYVFWTWRGLRVAWHAVDAYGMLLGVGIVSWVTFQAILHIAVITDTTPFTGIVLPFISYGGSSLVSTMASVGILLNIAQASSTPRAERSP